MDFELLKTSKRDPEKCILGEDRKAGVFLFGTRTLCQEFAESSFKSSDGTFQITPHLFYQVVLFLARIGGCYITCMIGLMKKKDKASYRALYGIMFSTFQSWGLRTDWTGDYYMMYFETVARTTLQVNIVLFLPVVVVILLLLFTLLLLLIFRRLPALTLLYNSHFVPMVRQTAFDCREQLRLHLFRLARPTPSETVNFSLDLGLSVAGRQRTKKLGLQIFSLNGSNGQFSLLLHWATTML